MLRAFHSCLRALVASSWFGSSFAERSRFLQNPEPAADDSFSPKIFAYAPDRIVFTTMKLSIPLLVTTATVAAFSTGASAFVHGGTNKRHVVSSLQNARVDTSDAIQEAMAASKKFGPTSKEARLAWESVEEMDASDNS